MKAIIKNILFLTWKLFRPKRKQDHLFLMGHPRSGSSLLMHLLSSNEELLGFGEYFIKYEDSLSLLRSEFDIRRKTNRLFRNKTYIVNQINHHSITPNQQLLIDVGVKVIFLIRSPEATLSSWKLFSEEKNKPLSFDAISEFYVERLNYLVQLASVLPQGSWCFLTYEELIETPGITLEKLTRFLSLKEPLSSSYKIQGFTQVWGDTSENITKGKIFRTDSKQLPIDSKSVEITSKAYRNTLEYFKLNYKRSS